MERGRALYYKNLDMMAKYLKFLNEINQLPKIELKD